VTKQPEPVTGQPQSFEPSVASAEPATSAEPAPMAERPDVTAPVARSRRKRARVVAPAGPPPGVSVGSVGGEFDS